MLQPATESDCEPIAKSLWEIWHHLKARQLPAAPPGCTSPEALAEKISLDLESWFVCRLKDSSQFGFFSIAPLGNEQPFKKWRFPERSIRIENFACLLPGEVLVEQLRLFALHFERESILLDIPTPLRDAYWAALKAGFKLLGESPLIIGTIAWLYLDRAERFEEIQAKLRRARLLTRPRS